MGSTKLLSREERIIRVELRIEEINASYINEVITFIHVRSEDGHCKNGR